MKKILIVSEYHLIKTFLLPTLNKISQEKNVQFDCFIISKVTSAEEKVLNHTFNNVFYNKYPKGIFLKIPKLRFLFHIYGLRKLAKEINKYDIIHINFYHYYFASFISILRKKTDKLFITFFGSDINDTTKKYKIFSIKKMTNLADYVFATNPSLLNKYENTYKFKDKKGILMPLMETFNGFSDYLKSTTKKAAKNRWNINQKLITCGYNAAPITQHNLIIKSLFKIKNQLKNYDIVFPMTYGNNAAHVRGIVKELLKNSELSYQIVENYLSLSKLFDLRLATDIFINIQKRDQLASSMLEHLVAGSVVITGKWLPYQSLLKKGVFLVLINSPDDLSQTLSEVITHIKYYQEKSIINREIIMEMMNWDNIKSNWYKYYELA